MLTPDPVAATQRGDHSPPSPPHLHGRSNGSARRGREGNRKESRLFDVTEGLRFLKYHLRVMNNLREGLFFFFLIVLWFMVVFSDIDRLSGQEEGIPSSMAVQQIMMRHQFAAEKDLRLTCRSRPTASYRSCPHRLSLATFHE